MTHHVKCIIASLLAALTLAVAIAGASASKLSISSQTFRTTWTALRLTANAKGISCPVTLEGSLHSASIVKTAELIGYITRASVAGASCTGGSGTIYSETLPWHIRYRGFSGTLPNITAITLGMAGARFRVQPTGESACNATTSSTHPAVGSVRIDARTHLAESLEPDRNARIPLESGLCPFAGEGSFEGVSQTLTQLGSTARIEVTLIGPAGTFEPSPVSFGAIEPSQLAVRTVRFTASPELTINRITMTAANYFAITDPNSCVGARLAERATCSFKVVFVAPAEAGRRLTDTVTVETTSGEATDTIEGST